MTGESPVATTTNAPPPVLPRPFGLATAAFVVIASMVGSGVLTTSGFTMYFVGSNQLMLWLWVLGAVVALCGALSLAELAAAMPRSGGDYVFLHESYGPAVAFLSGWVSFLIGFGAPIAGTAFAAAKYLTAPWNGQPIASSMSQKAIATLVILVFAIVHTAGNQRSARVQSGTTVLKLSILILLAIAGIAAGSGHFERLADLPVIDWSSGERVREEFWPLVLSCAFSLVYISYAYTGWNGAAYLAGEIEDAQRRLPRAIMLGTLLVVVLYLALNVFYALALTPADLAAIVDDPANTQGLDAVAPIGEIAAQRVFGARIAGPLSLAIGVTLLSSLSAYVLTGPRVAFAMARAGHFPAPAGRLSRHGAPALATWMQVAWAIVLLWTSPFEKILLYAGVGLSLFSMLTVSAVYWLRWRRPELERPFRVPGYPVTPAVFLLVTGCLTAAAFYQQPVVSLYSLGSILLGIPVYLAIRRFSGERTVDRPA